ncbi:MAG: pro-sigmaK processing inhibitor BofA family protein [Ruminococcus sp.]|nr:pro-sigmaK processing inhibitor BofA family protein [Ruminococcus sp.]
MLNVFIVTVSTFLVFSFIHYAAKKKKPFKRAFLSMLLGVATLCAVDLFAGLTGVYIPVTRLTLLTSLAGGVPGVALLVLLSAF